MSDLCRRILALSLISLVISALWVADHRSLAKALPMRGTLVLTILTTKSSYVRNVEYPLASERDVPDTVQWWIAPAGTWRIRTYAIDHDIHTHFIGNTGGLEDLALANAHQHYGDVIKSQHVYEFDDANDAVETNAALTKSGLEPRIEIAEGQFIFWKPDEGRYHTQSEPK